MEATMEKVDLSAMTEDEARKWGVGMVRRYFRNRGLDVSDGSWECEDGSVDLVVREHDGTVVLVDVRTELDLGGSPQAFPALGIDGECQLRYRKIMLSYLSDHPEVECARFDVASVRILDEHNARLRHLVGAFNWEG